MIESITIKDFATYSSDTPQKLEGLSKFNFLFGSNGTGKTTISKIMANKSDFPECEIKPEVGTQHEMMVYNRDFVDQNFSSSREIKGVFTLGKEQKNIRDKILSTKEEVKELETKDKKLKLKLQGEDGKGGKKGEMKKIKEKFKDKCWSKKIKYDEKFRHAFEGFRGTKEQFKEEILCQKKANKAEFLTFTELEKKAKSVFSKDLKNKNSILPIDTVSILLHETNIILKKKIIGKENVDIAAMIKKLGNSDWVQTGRNFYNVNNEVCPFCQQKTDKEFSDSLSEYFDDAFKSDAKEIDDIKANYIKDADKIQEVIFLLVRDQSEFLEIEKLKSEQEILTTKIKFNNQKITEKQKEPSQIVDLDSLATVLKAINDMIDTANKSIDYHNNIAGNSEAEKKILRSQMWKLVIDDLKDEIKIFEENENNLGKLITLIEEDIKNINNDKDAKLQNIRKLEDSARSIRPTINSMNRLLNSCGFKGFNFAEASDTLYKIVRLDGSDVKNTLSEGEKSFVTFLYFYHLIKGSVSDSDLDITTDRIVVFDDPVSSIDSDILFIVSSLIKDLFKDVDEKKGHIKQVFVFTHNVYFHKEVSYNTKNSIRDNMKFWIVRKPEQYSKIEPYNKKNPVTTSYQLLWGEVRRAQSIKEGEKYSSVSIQNTLRRILEYYFRILGSFLNYDEICEKFDKIDEKIVCKSLIAWIHKGSHFIDEDEYVSNDDSKVDTYLRVFEKIFSKLGHEAHYTMMMNVPE